MINYIRWTGLVFTDGYEILNQTTGQWHPVPVEDIRAFSHDGGAVHVNPTTFEIAAALRRKQND